MVLDSGLADINAVTATSYHENGFNLLSNSLEKCRGSKLSNVEINKYICMDHIHIPPILGKNIKEDIRAQILFENGILQIE